MQKMLRRTVTVGTLILITLGIIIVAAAPAIASESNTDRFIVDGLDGIVAMYDVHMNTLIIPADCARVITESGTFDFVTLHTDGTTATPEYIKACF